MNKKAEIIEVKVKVLKCPYCERTWKPQNYKRDRIQCPHCHNWLIWDDTKKIAGKLICEKCKVVCGELFECTIDYEPKKWCLECIEEEVGNYVLNLIQEDVYFHEKSSEEQFLVVDEKLKSDDYEFPLELINRAIENVL